MKNFCAVNIHGEFSSSLIIMAKHIFLEPQPDSDSHTFNDLPTLWKVASWAYTDITFHCSLKFKLKGDGGKFFASMYFGEKYGGFIYLFY